MNIRFNKVILHNFLSFGHSEIDLTDRGYCLVSGINRCPKDDATSNGSGKSSIWSSICWALTGETIQGLTSDIKNLFIGEKLCYVELHFTVDKDSYIVIRYKEPKSDLVIKLNDVDISGKGIRDSELVLSQHLPDLNKDLVASVILLGQGLPNKLASYSPSGRKELLEKLSKSDFMIEDIKNRVIKRIEELKNNLREYEDKILSLNSQKLVHEQQYQQKELELNELNKPQNYDKLISDLEIQIKILEEAISKNSSIIDKNREENSVLNETCTNILESKNKDLNKQNEVFNDFKSKYLVQQTECNSNIKILNDKINQAKNIKDICPTCGQKIPNIIKPDTSKEEAELKNLNESLDNMKNHYNSSFTQHNEILKQIEESYNKDISNLSFKIKGVKEIIDLYTNDSRLKSSQLINLNSELERIKLQKYTFETKLSELQKYLVETKKVIDDLVVNISNNTKFKDDTSNHLSVVNQMLTLVKRDFRGYLLQNVISFIDSKSKDYCSEVFGSNELDFKLDGNNISIFYCSKPYESLSGGEKQKVDLVLQFAIRDMMSKYLNFSSNILVLDEIFDNLDARSTNKVLNLISNELKDVESLFIVSHHADELDIPYDNELVVEKDYLGISEVK